MKGDPIRHRSLRRTKVRKTSPAWRPRPQRRDPRPRPRRKDPDPPSPECAPTPAQQHAAPQRPEPQQQQQQQVVSSATTEAATNAASSVASRTGQSGHQFGGRSVGPIAESFFSFVKVLHECIFRDVRRSQWSKLPGGSLPPSVDACYDHCAVRTSVSSENN